ncbi:polysaccharide deacetylase family sporulation protein PdaB [Pseudalkalibacillus hwajinpoensis]|uniref:polysaccharide deacetylase family sporulation protein PdaB n=1 Tax=Guptibacillus hwajinpoensis TaxID=208199 RepID=UPI001CD2A6D2|nr:polysaccharide deacetylase family sporulation protein PdaB [Pseudalkalibacillus hwajinpoensis]MCA0993584.1 polysaccharide deacetylase family sporulation protein PdaB [Pseudalkalibacillus hwajinpoensis]
MKFFWIWNGIKIKQGLIIVAAAFFAAIILFVEGGDLAVFTNNDVPLAVDQVKSDDKRLALTFDISWGETKALPILEELKQHKVKASFFISGAWAERHPEVVQQIAKDGHEIGNLGYRYENYTTMKDEEIKKDIIRSSEAIKKVTDEEPQLLRPPNGNFDKRVLTISDKFNYTLIHWSLDSEDWKNPGVENIVENVTKKIDPGDIILMHASDSAKQTAEALPEMIAALKKKGYSFATVSELVSNANINSKEVK